MTLLLVLMEMNAMEVTFLLETVYAILLRISALEIMNIAIHVSKIRGEHIELFQSTIYSFILSPTLLLISLEQQ